MAKRTAKTADTKCHHPNPYAWHAFDGALCLACTVCGAVLQGGVALDDLDGEPIDNAAAMDDLAAIDVLACDERDWMLSEQMRCALADAHLATITMDVPF